MKKNALSGAALILAIIGLFTMIIGGSFIFGGLAIILAILSRAPGRMDTKAKAAVITSAVGITGSILLSVGSIVWLMTDDTALNTFEEYLQYYSDAYEMEYGSDIDNPYDDILQFIDDTLGTGTDTPASPSDSVTL